eukprot:TRINITY_DN61488_c0_g1_i1.p1 TRINITY_DN61488_c0_g1~~TRINITY_DN61488_c0_g1_i1.p1  ORF type:complete len:320 (+),score=64.76 TRINITY_DN61488_c0_g1_i1:103-1062(+)
MACWKVICKLVRARQAAIEDVYFFEEESIGEGAFSVVFQGVCKKTSVKVAVKKSMQGKGDARLESRDAMANEVKLLQSCTHENIISVHHYFESGETTYMVTEYCSGGELFVGIVSAGSFSEKQAAFIMRQICRVLVYLHGCGICHRDTKPEQFLLLDESPLESCVVKLVDFGLSCYVAPGDVLRDPVGTILYVAPEVLAKEYGLASDVWSFGMVVYVLLSGSHPFDAPTAKEVAKKVKKANYTLSGESWETVSKDARDFISGLLTKNPAERLSAKQALEHQWIEAQAASAGELDPGILKRLKRFVKESQRARELCMMRA